MGQIAVKWNVRVNLSAIKRSDRGGVERPRESERHHKEQIAVNWNVRVNLSAFKRTDRGLSGTSRVTLSAIKRSDRGEV